MQSEKYFRKNEISEIKSAAETRLTTSPIETIQYHTIMVITIIIINNDNDNNNNNNDDDDLISNIVFWADSHRIRTSRYSRT